MDTPALVDKQILKYVTYWPSTEPSIKRCTCVNKRKQVDVKQKYNLDTDGLSQLGTRGQRENSLQTEGLRSSVTHGWAAQPGRERSVAMVRISLGQCVVVCPRLQLTSHTRPTSNLSRIKCERYIFIKKCVRSFIEVRHYAWLCSAYIYSCIMSIQHIYQLCADTRFSLENLAREIADGLIDK